MGEVLNGEFVEREIRRLQAEYREVEVVEDVVEVPAEEFPDYVENAREGYVGGTHVWVTRTPEQAGEPTASFAGDAETRERVLLILPRGGSTWGPPGGGVEGGESFEQAARREVREETGVDCEVTGLWRLRRIEWRSEDGTADTVTHSLHPCFDARYVGGTIAVQAAEVNGAAWFAERPEPLVDLVEPRADAFF